MATSAGVRIRWTDLPGRVRSAVEEIIGGSVVGAYSQTGGYSPSTADRVRTVDGRRAFVKAVSSAQNPRTPQMHRHEARVTAALPSHVPAPRLLGSYDDGDWVALVLEDIEGRPPRTPWDDDELERVLATLRMLAERLTPSPLSDLPTAAQTLRQNFDGWQRVAADPPADLAPWAAERLDELRALAPRAMTALAGETLVHLDIRTDNLLLTADGRAADGVVLVDWAWACTGPAWLDTLLLLVNVRLLDGGDGARADRLLVELAGRTGVDPADLTAVLAGFAGYFVDICRQPSAPGLPTVRAFQRAQAEALLSLLAERLG
ncbi:aminoglycoside phosphotransferase family protein [Micromonospora sp. NPDC050397]|uniref:aminoglycoside phosphotransferase family protein n=1 Tax=Micromonospora sp. NPDC050397 TaxID=3364279 RepID=UPI00384B7242